MPSCQIPKGASLKPAYSNDGPLPEALRHFANGSGVTETTNRKADPCVMVIFGGTGDLTRRKLIPTLCNLASENILSEHFAIVVPKWPRLAREIFEFYFFEGLEPEEIAMVIDQPLKIVRENIASIEQRVRERILRQEAFA
jgi:hypothetical protein